MASIGTNSRNCKKQPVLESTIQSSSWTQATKTRPLTSTTWVFTGLHLVYWLLLILSLFAPRARTTTIIKATTERVIWVYVVTTLLIKVIREQAETRPTKKETTFGPLWVFVCKFVCLCASIALNCTNSPRNCCVLVLDWRTWPHTKRLPV